MTTEGTAPRAARRETVVNGRRVHVIDLHAHCGVAEAAALMGLDRPLPALLLDNVQQRLAAMDAQGIDVEALSINPFWYRADRDLAAEVIRIQNEALAAWCATQPERFVALASVALQHPNLAAEQLETAVKRLGLRGALIGGSVNGEELADPRFHPFWAKAEELETLIFIHPQGTAELASRLRGNGVLDNVIGNPLETTIALSHLIFEGTLDRFPRPQDPRGARRRLSALVRGPLRRRLCHLPQPLHADQAEADGLPAPALLRLARVHAGGAAPPRRRGWAGPDRAGHRLSVPLDLDRGRARARHAGAERRRPRRDPWRERRTPARPRRLSDRRGQTSRGGAGSPSHRPHRHRPARSAHAAPGCSGAWGAATAPSVAVHTRPAGH